MSTDADDLDLLLSLQDGVLETPPASPSAIHSGYLPDDALPKRRGEVDMSVFRSAVQDCLDYEPETSKQSIESKNSNDDNVERFSGVRIRNPLVSPVELANRFSDIRFVQLPEIKKLLLVRDTLSGCWATIGVLTKKGETKNSSIGKPYCMWKVGSLNEDTASVFLFGTAYQKNSMDEVGTVFAFFNACAHTDSPNIGVSLSVYNASQILKMGTSVDHVVCKGSGCTNVINRRLGIYCKHHRSAEGIYMVVPHAQKRDAVKPKQVMSVEGLKKALRNAGKVTTNKYSQGIRMCMEDSKNTNKGHAAPNKPPNSSQKRSSSPAGLELRPVKKTSQLLNAKRIKAEQRQLSSEKTNQTKEKMIELVFVSSDEET